MKNSILVFFFLLVAALANGQSKERAATESKDDKLIQLHLLQSKEQIVNQFGSGPDSLVKLHEHRLNSYRIEFFLWGHPGFLFFYFDSLDRNVGYLWGLDYYSYKDYESIITELKEKFGKPTEEDANISTIWTQTNTTYFLSKLGSGRIVFGKWINNWFIELSIE